MSKNVLIISSSPRLGGNSDVLCDEFLKGVLDAGHKGEKIFLKDKKINYCTGCGFCNSKDYTMCAQNDDMKEILDKMQEADVIVFSTPIYFYSMAGQMKTFIDRICARYTHITNKEFYYIMTAADTKEGAIKYTLGEFKGLLACLTNCTEKGYLFASGVWKKGEINNTKFPKEAYAMGKSV